jgi:choline dehydrogenase
VEKQRLRWDILDAFAQAAQQAGIPATDDFNRGTTKAWATSRSTRKAAGAGTRPRPSCAHLLRGPNFEMWTGARSRQLITIERQRDGQAALHRRAGVGRRRAGHGDDARAR